MPEAVLVKMTPPVWRAIRRQQRAAEAEGKVVSPPEVLRRAALSAWRSVKGE